MRVGVIRNDLPGPLFLADLESSSQVDAPVEPAGQTRYVSRPTALTVGAMLSASIPASLLSSVDLVFPVNIAAPNQTLKIRSSVADPYASVLIPVGAYADIAALAAAVNSVLPAGFVAIAKSALRLAFQTVACGTGVRIECDSVAGGSTANTPLGLLAAGDSFTIPSATAYLLAASPVGGPLNVSLALIYAQLGAGLTAAQVEAAASAIAPKFVETDVAIKSFAVGNLSSYLSSSYTPDPKRIPALATGAAIAVVADDGITPFASSLPTLSNAQYNFPAPGMVTLTGTGLASAGSPNAEVEATVVRFSKAGYPEIFKVLQHMIVAAGGTVTQNLIVIPASLVPASVSAGFDAQVVYTSLASNPFTLV